MNTKQPYAQLSCYPLSVPKTFFSNQLKTKTAIIKTMPLKQVKAAPHSILFVSKNKKEIKEPAYIFFPPPSSKGTTNSPNDGINTRKNPVRIPEEESGITTLVSVCQRFAPKSNDASKTDLLIPSILL